MPRGPLPNPDRQRRNAPTFEQVELGSAPAVGGAPVLSKAALRRLHPETREWWATWIGSPQASQFGATDWRRLRMVVLPIAERLNRAIERQDDVAIVRLADQLDKQEREFGATPGARLRLRWTLRGQAGDQASDAKPVDGRPALRRVVGGDPRLALVPEAK